MKIKPLIVETAVLIALAPGLMFGGYSVLIVPVGVALVWGLLHWWTGSAWPRSDLNWCIAAILVLTVASLIRSTGDLLWAMPKVTTLVFGIAWFFALIRWHDAGLTPQSLVAAHIAACVALTLAGTFGSNWLLKVWPLSDVTATLPHVSLGVGGLHPNAVAGTLLLLIPLCLPPLSQTWGGERINARLRRGAAGAVLIVALALLLLTQSRGGWLGATAIALALVLYRFRGMRARPAVPIVLAFGLACAVVALGTALPGASWAGADLSVKWAGRLEIWRLGYLFMRDFPWTGVGFNGFRHLTSILYAPGDQTGGLDIAHPHNMWLSAGVDLGIPGIAAYGVLWVLGIRRLLRVAATGSQREVLISQCLLASWAGFWTFGIADAIPLGTKLGTALWLSFALSQVLSRERRQT